MDFDKLKLFVQVAELGSLSKVAALTGCAQSAISRKITALEQECGGRLFSRTGRGVSLSEFGERILPRVQALLEEAENLSGEIKNSAGIPRGRVRVGVVPSLAHPAVSMLMRRARALYPGIHLYVVDGSAGQLDEWLSAGRVDVAVLFRHNESIPNGEHALAVVDAHLVSKPGDALTRNPTIDFVKLAGVPLILPGLPNGWRVAIERIATQKRIELSVVMESDSLPIIENVAAEGDAYAVLGSHVANRDVERGVLQSSAIVNPRIRLTVTLATTTAQPLTLACREVAMLIRRIFDELIAEGTLKVDLPDAKKSGARSGSRKVRLASAVRTGAGGTTG